MLRWLILFLTIMTAAPAIAAEESGSGEKAPIDQMIQFMRTEGNHPQVWLVYFKITATHAADLSKVHNAMPHIVDDIIVKLTSGDNAVRRPEVAEVKQTVNDAILENVGQIEGLDVTIQKLGRV